MMDHNNITFVFECDHIRTPLVFPNSIPEWNDSFHVNNDRILTRKYHWSGTDYFVMAHGQLCGLGQSAIVISDFDTDIRLKCVFPKR